MSVLLTRVDTLGTATLTLNRPEVHNALNEELVHALTAELNRLAADAAVRVVVIAAAGRSFSAGVDLEKLQRMHQATPEQMRADTEAVVTMLETLDKFPKPTIGRIHGPAFGGGVGVAICCDLCIASSTVLFGITEVRVGLAPLVMNQYLLRRIGIAATRRYILTGERFDAHTARDIGLVAEVVQAEFLDATIARFVEQLRRGAPSALTAAKASLAELTHPEGTPSLDELVTCLARLRQGEESREGTAAFLEKRPPSWARTPG